MRRNFIFAIFTSFWIITLSGCAAILSGTSQTITLETTPAGGRCEVWREGRVIGTVEQTPGVVHIKKTKHDIDVVCKKAGVGEGKAFGESGTEGSTAGNILLGGVIGWGVDSALGADNKYPDRINVNLTPEGGTTEVMAERPLTPAAKEKMASLEKLKKEGILSESEFEQKRTKVISSM